MKPISLLRSLLGTVLTLATCLSFIGSACDLAADECDAPESNRCTADNVAIVCRRPGAEAHRIEYRTPCGGQTCTMGADRLPFCARSQGACKGPQDSKCEGNVAATCRQTAEGGFVWSDEPCDSPGLTCIVDQPPRCGR